MNLDKRCYDFPDCKNCPLNHTTMCLVATHQMHLTFKGVIKNIKKDLRQIKKQEQEKEKENEQSIKTETNKGKQKKFLFINHELHQERNTNIKRRIAKYYRIY